MRHPADDGYDDMADLQHSPAATVGASAMSRLRDAHDNGKRSAIQAKRAAVTPKQDRGQGGQINNDNARDSRRQAPTGTKSPAPQFIRLAREEMALEFTLSMRAHGWSPTKSGPMLRGSTIDVPDPRTTRMPYLRRPFRVHLKGTNETIWCQTALEARNTIEAHYKALDDALAAADEKIHPFRSPLTRDALMRAFHDYKKGFTHE